MMSKSSRDRNKGTRRKSAWFGSVQTDIIFLKCNRNNNQTAYNRISAPRGDWNIHKLWQQDSVLYKNVYTVKVEENQSLYIGF
jgi:hypothetical protein